MTKIQVGMNLLEMLMKSEGGRKNILKYAKRIQKEEEAKNGIKGRCRKDTGKSR